MMIPEITIKISFSPPPESKAETTVSSTHIAPPESTEAAALADVPPPPQAQDDTGSSVAFEAPPAPTVDPVEGDIPPLPDVEDDGEVPGEDGEPPPAPNGARPPGKR